MFIYFDNLCLRNVATGISPASFLISANSDLVNLKPTISDCFSAVGFGFLQAVDGCLLLSSP